MEESPQVPITTQEAPINNLTRINIVFHDYCLPLILSTTHSCMILCDFPSRISDPPQISTSLGSTISLYSLIRPSHTLTAVFMFSLKKPPSLENSSPNHLPFQGLSGFWHVCQVILLSNWKLLKLLTHFPTTCKTGLLIFTSSIPFLLRLWVKKALGSNSLIFFISCLILLPSPP